MDRALDFGSSGWEFDPLQVHFRFKSHWHTQGLPEHIFRQENPEIGYFQGFFLIDLAQLLMDSKSITPSSEEILPKLVGVERPFQRVLSYAPPLYDGLGTGAKAGRIIYR